MAAVQPTQMVYLDEKDTAPAIDAVAVSPSDSADLPGGLCRALWIGGAGDISVITAKGTTVTISTVPAGTLIPLRVTRVRLTNTTATNITAWY